MSMSRCLTATVAAFLLLINAPVHSQQLNILLVVVDDMGWTDIGSYGGEIDTPNLDQLAARGLAFDGFYVSVSCSPTRAMLLSGTDNHVAGLGNMGEMLAPEQMEGEGYEGYLNRRVVSLAEVLREGGYRTYMAGKWHLGHEPDQFPHARGFDRSFAMLYGGASYWSDMIGVLAGMQERARYVRDDQVLEALPDDFYATRSYADFIIDTLREDRDDERPFFAYLALTAPHDPLHVPEPWLSRYRGAYDDGYEALKRARAARAREQGLVADGATLPERPPRVPSWDALDDDERALQARGMEVYAGMVSNLDYHVGRVLGFLQDIGEAEDTIVLFMSDNGPNPWSSDEYPGYAGSDFAEQFDDGLDNIGHPLSNHSYGAGWAWAGSGPLDLFKMAMAEGGIRSPLIVAGAGVEGGRRTDALAYVTDIMPTLLDMAGLEHPETFEGREVAEPWGRSMRGVLSGEARVVYGPDEFLAGEMQNGKWVRRGDFKAVKIPPPFGPDEWKLYNVAEDPGETRDLADEHPELLDELVEAWKDYADEVGVILIGRERAPRHDQR
jgi:arylsulfatase